MVQTATNVLNDPSRSPDDQALAAQMLAKMPEFRARLTAAAGAAGQSVPPGADTAERLFPESEIGANRQISVVMQWDHTEEVSGALSSASAAFAAFGGVGGGLGGGLVPGPSCDREVWDWAKSAFAFGTGVVGVAATVSAIGASGGTAGPVLGPTLWTFGSATVIAAGDLYFTHRALWDCVSAHNSAR